MKILFISDLHLTTKRANIIEKFIIFLQKKAIKANSLYILGDLFDRWIGDDDDQPMHHLVSQSLYELHKQGIAIYFMPGNRDFLIGKHFCNNSGCQLLPDPTVIDLYGRQTVITHGDLLCTQDVNYLKFRKKIRKPWVKQLFLSLPLCIRRYIADKITATSKRHMTTKTMAMMNVTKGEDVKMMQHYQSSLLIHGHTHKPKIHHLNGKTRIVLASWHTKGNALDCQLNDQGELVYQLIYF